MEKSNRITQGMLKLIAYASKSVEGGYARNNLDTYKAISGSIKNLAGLDPVRGEQIGSCLTLLGLMIKLQGKIIKADEIPDKEVPQIYDVAQNLNKILMKSAKEAVKSGDNAHITEQCEAFLEAADTIRSDRFLRSSGILNADLKDIIGRLREKADIVNLFEGEESRALGNIMKKAEVVLQGDDLNAIGQVCLKLDEVGEKLKNEYMLKATFTRYLTGYKNQYIAKIDGRMNFLKEKVETSDLFECRELFEEMEKLEILDPFHQDSKLSKRIRFFRNRMLKGKLVPIETLVNETIEFIMGQGNNFFSIEYEGLYDAAHGENDIFTPDFYEKTLKGLPPLEAVDLLKEKRQKMDQVDIGKAGQFDYETGLKEKIENLIELFESSIAAFSGK